VFLQALLRTVAYGTLARRARKARHLAAAHHLERTWPGEARDIAEVLASHYQQAIHADPQADDVASLRASARETLTEAGRAAASLALGPEAQRYLEQAAELADTDAQRAELLLQAGRALMASGDHQAAEQRLRRALELHERSGDSLAGQTIIALAELLLYAGRVDEGSSMLDRFRSSDGLDVDPITRAQALAELANTQIHSGNMDDGGALIEEALLVLEEEQAWGPLTSGLITRGVYLVLSHRYEEGDGVLRHALRLAEEYDFSQMALRARFNLAAISIEGARLSEAVDGLSAGLQLARERGDRHWERALVAQQIPSLVTLGRWEEATAAAAPLLDGAIDVDSMSTAAYMVVLATARGDEPMLTRCVDMAHQQQDSPSVDLRASARLVSGRVALDRGDHAEVQRVVTELLGHAPLAAEFVDEACELSVQAAVACGDEAAMSEREAFLSSVRPARNSPLLRAGATRLRAELAHRRGDGPAAERDAAEAEALIRQVGARPRLAQALLERARRTGDSEALAEARAIYSQLGATRWLSRVNQEFEVVA
jgi:tetratricopeptide (TPR) repeat protein